MNRVKLIPMEHPNQLNPSEPASEEHLKANTTALGPSENQPKSAETQGTKKLSKEEQMAKFEEAMKNEDWGHQPC